MQHPLRNIAIIYHVDHTGGLPAQTIRHLRRSRKVGERIMDSNAIEKECGITILAKNCAIDYGGTRINVADTPGHADFGGGKIGQVLAFQGLARGPVDSATAGDSVAVTGESSDLQSFEPVMK
jgi:predicted membrane GTPase involved in stress response